MDFRSECADNIRETGDVRFTLQLNGFTYQYALSVNNDPIYLYRRIKCTMYNFGYKYKSCICLVSCGKTCNKEASEREWTLSVLGRPKRGGKNKSLMILKIKGKCPSRDGDRWTKVLQDVGLAATFSK